MAGDWKRWDRWERLYMTQGLTAREMRVLGCLLGHSDDHGHAWPSSTRIGELLEMRDDDVRKQIRSLVKKGLLEPCGKVRMVNRYECCPRPVGVVEPRGPAAPGSSSPGAQEPRRSGSWSPGKSGSWSPPEETREETKEPKEEQILITERRPLSTHNMADSAPTIFGEPEPHPRVVKEERLRSRVRELWQYHKANRVKAGLRVNALGPSPKDLAAGVTALRNLEGVVEDPEQTLRHASDWMVQADWNMGRTTPDGRKYLGFDLLCRKAQSYEESLLNQDQESDAELPF